ncbi:MAG: DEAD/DEAH box helicase family protein [Atopobiaceae bacterium]|jgi:type I restriction enzyme R subunit|nr:DEAD/DEAH box helicase family protein [Atopobiaceae bacterium]MCI2172618.1 DEAD/DEAH box helicase family protein [Atopobiaceae bacterium]MCI2206925.1 DEAD/DEAH box helicase family protein [Atopobiaceae bacterium]
MNESDTRLKLIDPALKKAWNPEKQIYTEFYFTAGEIVVRGNATARKKPKKADYLLMYARDVPLAIVEAKDTNHTVGAGLQQAISYSQALHVPFAYSSNGYGFIEHDFYTGKERSLSMDDFPSPEELWNRYKEGEGLPSEADSLVTAPYYYEHESKIPRYFQRIAVNKCVEAIAKGERRLLLVMATGTGKTFTAFQIVHRLRETGRVKKVLYLADRNVLVDQTIEGDFKPLKKVVTKIEHRKMDPAYEVYFALYQQLVGEDGEEVFRAFDPGFFDLIIVDECHRGSAAEDSAWRKILEYFESAIQIGMTATPKETKDVSNIDYFGEPIYTYSLKQGIEDGFLAPYKVIRPKMNIDIYGFRPKEGAVDDRGQTIEDKVYEQYDFDRDLVIRERTEEVAKKVTQFLKETDRLSKTIVFCVDIDHAERMREALVNENSDMVAEHPDYVIRITGDELEGKARLDDFMDPDEKFPSIVTTSKLLTTGVNCPTCKVIVLDNVFGDQGMTEFKQIIGRGTRVSEPYGKLYFTIIDFRDASRLFADPSFDGEPTQIFEPPDDGSMNPPDDKPDSPPDVTPPLDFPDWPGDNDPAYGHAKYYIHGVKVNVISERVEYYSTDGNLVTESLRDYTRKNILGQYDTLDHFLVAWNAEDRKQAIVDALEEHGALLEELRRESGQDQMSDFDLICHIAYDQKPLTRSERADNVRKKGYLYEYSGLARDVLETLLDKYATSNLIDLDDTRVLDLEEFRRYGSPMKIVRAFGGKSEYVDAAHSIEDALYTA